MHCIVFAPPRYSRRSDSNGINQNSEDNLTDNLTVSNSNPKEVFRVLIHVSVIKMATKQYIYFQILNLISLSY